MPQKTKMSTSEGEKQDDDVTAQITQRIDFFGNVLKGMCGPERTEKIIEGITQQVFRSAVISLASGKAAPMVITPIIAENNSLSGFNVTVEREQCDFSLADIWPALQPTAMEAAHQRCKGRKDFSSFLDGLIQSTLKEIPDDKEDLPENKTE